MYAASFEAWEAREDPLVHQHEHLGKLVGAGVRLLALYYRFLQLSRVNVVDCRLSAFSSVHCSSPCSCFAAESLSSIDIYCLVLSLDIPRPIVILAYNAFANFNFASIIVIDHAISFLIEHKPHNIESPGVNDKCFSFFRTILYVVVPKLFGFLQAFL